LRAGTLVQEWISNSDFQAQQQDEMLLGWCQYQGLFSQDQDPPDQEAKFYDRGYQRDGIQAPADQGRYPAQDQQPEDNQHSSDVGMFAFQHITTSVIR
jgi:hypothetical protein